MLLSRQILFQRTQLHVAVENELQSGLIRVSDFLFDKSDCLAGLQ